IIRLICRVSSSWPRPKPSTPALFEITVRFLTALSRKAPISASGMPHRPKPPTASNWPSFTMPLSASAALGYTLFICHLQGIWNAARSVLPNALRDRYVELTKPTPEKPRVSAALPPLDYRTAFDLAPIGLVISANRLMVDCNQQLLDMFGATRGQLIGQSFEVLYPTHDEFERTGA